MPRTLPAVLRLGTAQTLAWGSTYYLPAILANAMAADLGVGTPTVFVAFSLALLLSGLLGPAAGRLIDVHGGHRVLPASNIVFAVALALLGISPNVATLFGAWLLMGVAMSAGLYEGAFAALARIFGAEARRSIAGITLIAGFASTICWPLSALMEGALGWRATCFVWALVHLAVCLPLNLGLPHGRAAAHAGPGGEREEAPRNGRLVMAALAFVFAATWFCSTAMAAHLPRLLQEAGMGLSAAIAAAALVGPAQVAARLFEFTLLQKIHPLFSARVACLGHPIGAGVLVLFGAPAGIFFTLFHGAGNGVMTIAKGTLPLRLFGAHGYGLRQGWITAPARLLQGAAPFVFDLALTRYGAGAMALTATLSLLSFAVLLAVPYGAAANRQSA